MGEHFLLLYEYVEDMAERRGPYRVAHLAHIQAAREAGRILAAGGLGDPVRGGAIAFQDVDRGVVEAFAASDPYAAAGLIVSRRIEPWQLV